MTNQEALKYFDSTAIGSVLNNIAEWAQLQEQGEKNLGIFAMFITYKMEDGDSRGLAVYLNEDMMDLPVYILYDEFMDELFLATYADDIEKVAHVPLSFLARTASRRYPTTMGGNITAFLPILKKYCWAIVEQAWENITTH